MHSENISLFDSPFSPPWLSGSPKEKILTHKQKHPPKRVFLSNKALRRLLLGGFFASLGLGDNLFGYLLGTWVVVAELHGELAATGGHGTQ